MCGELRMHRNSFSGTWQEMAQPFYTFDIPKDGSGIPARHRSSGVRDIAFDPNFATNGFIYVFYMKNNPRQNRVVRIKTSSANPDLAEANLE